MIQNDCSTLQLLDGEDSAGLWDSVTRLGIGVGLYMFWGIGAWGRRLEENTHERAGIFCYVLVGCRIGATMLQYSEGISQPGPRKLQSARNSHATTS